MTSLVKDPDNSFAAIEIKEEQSDDDEANEVEKPAKNVAGAALTVEVPPTDDEPLERSPTSYVYPKNALVLNRLKSIAVKSADGVVFHLPIFILDTLNLLGRNMKIEGLFRFKGNAERVELMKYAFFGEFGVPEYCSMFDICDLIKLFFTSMEEPLLTKSIEKRFLKLDPLTYDGQTGQLLQLFKALPKRHRDVLAYFCLKLKEISKFSSVNKMDIMKLAQYVAPSIFRSGSPKSPDSVEQKWKLVQWFIEKSSLLAGTIRDMPPKKLFTDQKPSITTPVNEPQKTAKSQPSLGKQSSIKRPLIEKRQSDTQTHKERLKIRIMTREKPRSTKVTKIHAPSRFAKKHPPIGLVPYKKRELASPKILTIDGEPKWKTNSSTDDNRDLSNGETKHLEDGNSPSTTKVNPSGVKGGGRKKFLATILNGIRVSETPQYDMPKPKVPVKKPAPIVINFKPDIKINGLSKSKRSSYENKGLREFMQRQKLAPSTSSKKANVDASRLKMRCPTCSLELYKHNYSSHRRIHTGELPFTCMFCKKCFRTSSSLTVHIRTHTGDKPYACEQCSYSCITKRNLDRHIYNNHVKKFSSYSVGGQKRTATRLNGEQIGLGKAYKPNVSAPALGLNNSLDIKQESSPQSSVVFPASVDEMDLNDIKLCEETSNDDANEELQLKNVKIECDTFSTSSRVSSPSLTPVNGTKGGEISGFNGAMNAVASCFGKSRRSLRLKSKPRRVFVNI